MGLGLAVLFGMVPIARMTTDYVLLKEQPRELADRFLEYLRQDDPRRALMLRAVPDVRKSLDDDEAVRLFFRNNVDARSDLAKFVHLPVARTLLALGQRARIRYYGTMGVGSVGDRALVHYWYTVTFDDEQGNKKTFFVGLTMERKPTRNPELNPCACRISWDRSIPTIAKINSLSARGYLRARATEFFSPALPSAVEERETSGRRSGFSSFIRPSSAAIVCRSRPVACAARAGNRSSPRPACRPPPPPEPCQAVPAFRAQRSPCARRADSRWPSRFPRPDPVRPRGQTRAPPLQPSSQGALAIEPGLGAAAPRRPGPDRGWPPVPMRRLTGDRRRAARFAGKTPERPALVRPCLLSATAARPESGTTTVVSTENEWNDGS